MGIGDWELDIEGFKPQYPNPKSQIQTPSQTGPQVHCTSKMDQKPEKFAFWSKTHGRAVSEANALFFEDRLTNRLPSYFLIEMSPSTLSTRHPPHLYISTPSLPLCHRGKTGKQTSEMTMTMTDVKLRPCPP
jgi:hypothetical protein